MQVVTALRRLWRAPGYALTVAVLSLAVVAINATVFAAIWGLHGKALPYRDGDALVRLQAWMVQFEQAVNLNGSLARQLAEDGSVFSGVIAYRRVAAADASEGAGRHWRMHQVTPDFAEVLGVAPALGRSFEAETRGEQAGLVLTDGLWRERFGANPEVLGQVVRLGDASLPVIGVMPPGFHFPDGDTQAFMALEPADSDAAAETGVGMLAVVARLAGGVSISAARARLDALIEHEPALATLRENYGLLGRVTPLREEIAGSHTQGLLLLAIAALLLLVTVAANLASLVQDRLLARRRDWAICRAIGASRQHLSMAAGIETVLPVLLGGLVGLGCVPAGLRFLQYRRLLPVDSVLSFGLDGIGLLAGLACVVIILLALLMVSMFGRVLGRESDSFRAHVGVAGQGRARPVLLVTQVAITTALVGSAALLLNSAWRLGQEDRGFIADPVVLTGVDLIGGRNLAHFIGQSDADREALQTRIEQLRETIAAHPGVERVALASMPPFSGWRYLVPMASPDHPGQRISVHSNQVSPDYFATLGMPILLGRDFLASDHGDVQPVIVDDLYRRRHLAATDPLDASLPVEEGSDGPGRPIVGVVESVRLARVDEPLEIPMLYSPWRLSNPTVFVLTRSAVAPLRMAEEVRSLIVRELPDAHVFVSERLATSISRTLVARRALLEVVGLFGILALALAMLGLYTVISVMVRRRTRELGMRMALGADATRILRWVIGRGGALVILGAVLGLIAGLLVASRIVEHLHRVGPSDPVTWLLVTCTVVFAGLSACWLPARRAARMSPALALRSGDGN